MVDTESSAVVVPHPDASGGRALPLVLCRTSPPVLPAAHIPRGRLWELVDRGARQGTTVISGAAGSGKTVLAASWAAAARFPGPVAWLSVDGDAGAEFWAHLLSALERGGILPAGRMRDDPAPSMIPRPASGGGFDGRWRELANILGELPTAAVLIVDDAHLIMDPVAVAGLELLASCAGSALRLVLCARYPIIALHRLRLDGRLVEVGPTDLAFTARETAALFEAHGVDLLEEGRDRLLERTEGWAAGLRLSAVHAAAHEPAVREPAVDGRDGSYKEITRRAVGEYLRAEVLGRHPWAVRRVLLRASVLDRLTGPLLETVAAEPCPRAGASTSTGGASTGASSGDPGGSVVDGRALLADLARTNSFVIGMDAADTWYRFHRLLADTMHADLAGEGREDEPELHLRAALWFAERRDVAAAVRHACRAGDWRYAACLLVEGGLGVITGSGGLARAAQVGPLVDVFPVGAAEQSTECALVVAARAVRAGDAEAARRCVHSAWTRLASLPIGRRRLLATVLDVLDARCTELRADTEAMLTCARKLLRVSRRPESIAMPEGGNPHSPDVWSSLSAVRAVAFATRGRAELWRGRPDGASEAFRAALRLAREVGAHDVELSCLGGLALAHAWRGRLRQAEFWAGKAVAADRGRSAATGRDDVQPAAATGLADAHLATALVFLEKYDLVMAGRRIREAERYCQQWPQPVTAELLVLLNAAVLARTGDVRMARRLVGAHRPVGLPDICARTRLATDGELLAAAGNPDAALAVLRRGITGHRPAPSELLALARVHLARADAPAAVAVLAPLLRADTGFGIGSVTAACVLDAVAASRTGEVARATASLARALALAEEEGVIRPFVDAGEEVRAMLRAHPGLGAAHRALVDQLLARGEAGPAGSSSGPGRGGSQRSTAARPWTELRPAPDRGTEPAVGAARPAAPMTADGDGAGTSGVTASRLSPARPLVTGPAVPVPADSAAPPVEPLSGREQAVLTYLPTMLTTAEIAKEMFVSTNTIKTHLKSIYRKLDVARRRDAVQRARALHLL
ncbi:LuxR C-terminal-related transcriptional regulator [Frankia sp. Cj5]|uniref:LuxR C-terminal-related transcriptional regulator n=1 Tax=Frankia sp. Cj5 TaxID=2880978 RepID=UPI001EF4F7B1|nr:LuxR C-terminal-related transcriptional regulator [Frankia sp. Cj5]